MTTATASAIHVRVPLGDAFEAEYLAADDLDAIYAQLIRDYPETHGHLDLIDVKVLWKAKGGKSQGKARLGYCAKTSGLAKFFAEADFVIWLAADTVLEREMTDSQIRAALSHEMRHIGFEEDDDGAAGKAVIVAHDAEIFFSEIKELGAWHEFITQTAETFEQAGMFG